MTELSEIKQAFESLNEKIEMLIGNDYIDQCFDELSEYFKKFHNEDRVGKSRRKEMLEIKGRLSNLESNRRRGIISDPDYNQERGRIRTAILGFLETFDPSEIGTLAKKTGNSPHAEKGGLSIVSFFKKLFKKNNDPKVDLKKKEKLYFWKFKNNLIVYLQFQNISILNQVFKKFSTDPDWQKKIGSS